MWKFKNNILVVTFLGALLCSLSSQANNPNNEEYSNGSVMFVGDSMVHGGPWSTSELCLKDYINAGIGGDSTTDILARIDDLLEEHSPRILVLSVGINDLNWANRKHLPELSIDEYLNKDFAPEANTNAPDHKKTFSWRYRQIIQKIRSAKKVPRIIMTSVLPIDQVKYRASRLPLLLEQPGFEESFLLTNQHVKKANQTLLAIAAKHNVSFVDTYSAFTSYINLYKHKFGDTPHDDVGIHFKLHSNYNVPFAVKSHYVLWADLIRPHLNWYPYMYNDHNPEGASKKTGCI